MSSNSSSPRPAADSSRDSESRLSEVPHVTKDDGSVETRYEYFVEPQAPPFTFEHDKQKRLFILRWPDGRTEHFRDNPARQLMVEPDPETSEMRPVIKRGQPAYGTSAGKSGSFNHETDEIHENRTVVRWGGLSWPS